MSLSAASISSTTSLTRPTSSSAPTFSPRAYAARGCRSRSRCAASARMCSAPRWMLRSIAGGTRPRTRAGRFLREACDTASASARCCKRSAGTTSGRVFVVVVPETGPTAGSFSSGSDGPTPSKACPAMTSDSPSMRSIDESTENRSLVGAADGGGTLASTPASATAARGVGGCCWLCCRLRWADTLRDKTSGAMFAPTEWSAVGADACTPAAEAPAKDDPVAAL
mmetsp:Transcript_34656/g.107049  ORF Transcript_34656/g.107049 Transcript_34656/m.107049 type:complete len:225 (-) Transcript_34656:226-900(-)